MSASTVTPRPPASMTKWRAASRHRLFSIARPALPPVRERPSPPSDAAALRRPASVVRNRRHVADRGDRESDRLQGPQGRLAARARTLHVHLEGAHAVLLRLAAGILGGDLRRVGRRLARALEALAAGR